MSKSDDRIILNDIDYDMIVALLNIVEHDQIQLTVATQSSNESPKNYSTIPAELSMRTFDRNVVIQIFKTFVPMPRKKYEFKVFGKLNGANVEFTVNVEFDQGGNMYMSIPYLQHSQANDCDPHPALKENTDQSMRETL